MNPFGIAILLSALAVGTESGRGVLRTILKATLTVGYTAQESILEMTEKTQTSCAEMMAELKADISAKKTVAHSQSEQSEFQPFASTSSNE